MNQRVGGGWREAEHGKVDHKESSDDEEVELLSHRKGAGGTDPPGADVRDTPETSGTQRDEWLFKTEPLQGARPRWDEDGRPPVVFDQTGVVDIEATVGVRSVGMWNSVALRPRCCHRSSGFCKRRR